MWVSSHRSLSPNFNIESDIVISHSHRYVPNINRSSVLVMAALYTMKQMMARKAEKALKEILDKADSNFNGKVELKDFTQILEANGVEVCIGGTKRQVLNK